MNNESESNKNKIFNPPPSIPKRRQDLLKINGWGYKNAKFIQVEKDIKFLGDMYSVIGGETLPNFKTFMSNVLKIDTANPINDFPTVSEFNEFNIVNSNVDKTKVNKLIDLGFDISINSEDRIFRAHGHTLHEIYVLRKGKFNRVPDVVVWVRNHDEVVKLVNFSSENNCVIIPFGGGTSVTGSLLCPETESRMIISLDTSQMNRIIWLDEANLTARIEAGIVGQDLDNRLAKLGYCVGHEPDSTEFSTLGGWVATRASGMKKNVYGNIEDILVHVTFVTPKGVIQRMYQSPRVSNGPDLHHFILGSEGTLGVVTEVTLKIRKLPTVKRYGSIVFPDFETGFECLREIARERLYPSSIRLMDNEQFQFGLSLKLVNKSLITKFLDGLKKLYLLSYKGFDPNKLCVATVLIEGYSQKEVLAFEKKIMAIAYKHKGLSGGEENGKRGYLLTYVIAYIRDLAMDNCIVAESFETSVPWDKAMAMCRAVKTIVRQETTRLGVIKPPFITCRVTQLYDAGVCVYFYLGINYSGMPPETDPVHLYEEVEDASREVILNYGGSLSHHHGIGSIRKKWLPRVISQTGMLALNAVKNALDPTNIFGNSALYVTNETCSETTDKLHAKL